MKKAAMWIVDNGLYNTKKPLLSGENIFNVGFGAASLVAGAFSFGTGTAAMIGAKAAAQATLKTGAKAVLKKVAKEGAEEGVEKVGISALAGKAGMEGAEEAFKTGAKKAGKKKAGKKKAGKKSKNKESKQDKQAKAEADEINRLKNSPNKADRQAAEAIEKAKSSGKPISLKTAEKIAGKAGEIERNNSRRGILQTLRLQRPSSNSSKVDNAIERKLKELAPYMKKDVTDKLSGRASSIAANVEKGGHALWKRALTKTSAVVTGYSGLILKKITGGALFVGGAGAAADYAINGDLDVTKDVAKNVGSGLASAPKAIWNGITGNDASPNPRQAEIPLTENGSIDFGKALSPVNPEDLSEGFLGGLQGLTEGGILSSGFNKVTDWLEGAGFNPTVAKIFTAVAAFMGGASLLKTVVGMSRNLQMAARLPLVGLGTKLAGVSAIGSLLMNSNAEASSPRPAEQALGM